MGYDVIKMKSIANQLNDLTYTDYFYRLMLIARSVFKWNNLPNGIDEKWIERFLFLDGNCLFYEDEKLGYMVARCTPIENINHYDEPTGVRPYATNYSGKDLENNVNCVLIRNNDLMLPTTPTIQLYALRLAEISRTIDVNISAQKTPFAIACSEKQRNSLKKAYTQISNGEPVIFADKTLDMDTLKVLNTNAPIVFPQLQIQKNAIWNVCMTFLGINNANQDKRERLVTDEVSANNEQIEASANVMLKSREKACELINEMFGLNISVELRAELLPKLEDIEAGIKGGEEND